MSALVSLMAQSGVPGNIDVEWMVLSPLIVLSIGGIVLITVASIWPPARGNGFPATFTIALVTAALLLIKFNWADIVTSPVKAVGGALHIGPFTYIIWAVICAAVGLTAGLFDSYLRREGFDGPEWYVLVLMSAAGGMIMVAAESLILLFIGLEVLSIAAYVLAALHLRRLESQEGAFKYFFLGALASAFFVYGIALAYGATGSLNLSGIATAGLGQPAGNNPLTESSLILAALAMLLVGFAFKVSAVPFHVWAPDVYQGSPSPAVSFMASVVKVAAMAAMARVLWAGFGYYSGDWSGIVVILAIASLLVGAFMALVQTNVKRMLAFSSITHAGFMLIAIFALSGSQQSAGLGAKALIFYLVAYSFMVVGTFGVATIVGRQGDGRHSLDDYRGLARNEPLLAGMMAILLFSQAGIPFTSGFIAKLRVILAAVDAEAYVLAGAAMLASVVAAVLYLRVIVSMFMTESTESSNVMVAHAIDDSVDVDTETDADPTAEALDELIVVPKAALLAIAICVGATLVLGLTSAGSDAMDAGVLDLLLQRP